MFHPILNIEAYSVNNIQSAHLHIICVANDLPAQMPDRKTHSLVTSAMTLLVMYRKQVELDKMNVNFSDRN